MKLSDAHLPYLVSLHLAGHLATDLVPVPASAPVLLCIVHCRRPLGIWIACRSACEDEVSNKDDPGRKTLPASLGMDAGRSFSARAGVIRSRTR